MIIPNEPDGGGGAMSVDDFLYDFEGEYIYRLHTIDTRGDTGSIERIICRECRVETMLDEFSDEWYCPQCEQ